MGFLRFLGRHVGASVFGAVGVTLLILGYADQAKDILTAFEPWQLQGTGALLFVVSVVTILYRWDADHRAVRQSSAESPAILFPASSPPAPAPQPIVSTPNSQRYRKKEGRTYLGENVTPEFLTGLYKDKTSLQGTRAVEPYVGKWMRISGTFHNVSIINKNILCVTFKEYAKTPYSVRMYFRENFDRLEVLRQGERLTIDGEIERIDPYSVGLEKSEIVAIDGDPAY